MNCVIRLRTRTRDFISASYLIGYLTRGASVFDGGITARCAALLDSYRNNSFEYKSISMKKIKLYTLFVFVSLTITLSACDSNDPDNTPDCANNTNNAITVFLYTPQNQSAANETARSEIFGALEADCFVPSNQPNYTDWPTEATSGRVTIGHHDGEENSASTVRTTAQNAVSDNSLSFSTFLHQPVSSNHVVVYLNF